MAAESAGQVLALPFAGAFVDRRNRLQVMRWTDLLRMVLLGLLGVAFATHRIGYPELALVVFVTGGLSGVFGPAYSAVRQRVFVPEIRPAANALSSMGRQGAGLLGPLIAGYLVAKGHVSLGFLADGVSFFISWLTLIGLNPLLFSVDVRPERSCLLADLREGASVVLSRPWLWGTVATSALVNVGVTTTTVVLVPWLLKYRLHVAPSDYGIVIAANSLGALLGALLYGHQAARWKFRGVLHYSLITAIGITFAVIARASAVLVIVAAFVALGGLAVVATLIWETSLQEIVSPDVFARVASLDMFGSMMLLPIGFAGVGWLANVFGAVPTMEGSAVLIVLTGALMFGFKDVRGYT
jgi:MFS family permease